MDLLPDEVFLEVFDFHMTRTEDMNAQHPSICHTHISKLAEHRAVIITIRAKTNSMYLASISSAVEASA